MNERKPVRRWIVQAVLYLLLGAVVNVAVAWGLAFFVDVEDQQGPRALAYWETGNDHQPYWRVSFVSKTGAKRAKYRPEETTPRWASELKHPHRQLPHWLAIDELPSDLEKTYVSSEYYNIEDARGWPALSLKCRYSDFAIYVRRKEWPHPMGDDPNNPFWERHRIEGDAVVITKGVGQGGIRLPLLPGDGVAGGIPLPARTGTGSSMMGLSHIHILPMRPIWDGCLVNTVFYGGILWVLSAAATTLRRRRRVRKGLCPKCAYPIGKSVTCTECGFVVH